MSTCRRRGGPRNGTGDPSTVCSLLAARRRRYVLYHLIHEAEPADLAEPECVGTDAEPGAETLGRVERSLYHVHLPELDRAGVVRFSTDRDRAALVDASLPSPFLDEAARREYHGAVEQ